MGRCGDAIPNILLFFVSFLTLGAFAGVCWFYGIENASAGGEERKEGKVKSLCAAFGAWSTASHVLDGVQFELRNEVGGVVSCQTTSLHTERENDLANLVRGECSNDGFVKKLVCNSLSRLIPAPAAEQSYRLGLWAFDALIGEVDVQLARTVYETMDTGPANCDSRCLKMKVKNECRVANGTHMTKYTCGALFRMAKVLSFNEPCYVLKATSEGVGFKLSDELWHSPGFDGYETDLKLPQVHSRCIRPDNRWNRKWGMQGTALDPNLVSTKGLDDYLSTGDVAITFRLETDPFVEASRLSSSTWDFGDSSAASQGLGACLIIAAALLSLSSLGCLYLLVTRCIRVLCRK